MLSLSTTEAEAAAAAAAPPTSTAGTHFRHRLAPRAAILAISAGDFFFGGIMPRGAYGLFPARSSNRKVWFAVTARKLSGVVLEELRPRLDPPENGSSGRHLRPSCMCRELTNSTSFSAVTQLEFSVSHCTFFACTPTPPARPPVRVSTKSYAGGSLAERRATPSARLTSHIAPRPRVRLLRN